MPARSKAIVATADSLIDVAWDVLSRRSEKLVGDQDCECGSDRATH
jgi:hypothetical protein